MLGIRDREFADEAGGVAADDRVGRHVRRHDRAGRDDGIRADHDAWKDDHVTSKPRISPDRDWRHAYRMVGRHLMKVRVVDCGEVADFSVIADRDFALGADDDAFVDEDVVADD